MRSSSAPDTDPLNGPLRVPLLAPLLDPTGVDPSALDPASPDGPATRSGATAPEPPGPGGRSAERRHRAVPTRDAGSRVAVRTPGGSRRRSGGVGGGVAQRRVGDAAHAAHGPGGGPTSARRRVRRVRRAGRPDPAAADLPRRTERTERLHRHAGADGSDVILPPRPDAAPSAGRGGGSLFESPTARVAPRAAVAAGERRRRHAGPPTDTGQHPAAGPAGPLFPSAPGGGQTRPGRPARPRASAPPPTTALRPRGHPTSRCSAGRRGRTAAAPRRRGPDGGGDRSRLPTRPHRSPRRNRPTCPHPPGPRTTPSRRRCSTAPRATCSPRCRPSSPRGSAAPARTGVRNTTAARTPSTGIPPARTATDRPPDLAG